jgi:hypothetical protein
VPRYSKSPTPEELALQTALAAEENAIRLGQSVVRGGGDVIGVGVFIALRVYAAACRVKD